MREAGAIVCRSAWDASDERDILSTMSTDRITINADVRFGKPCVRGTRITVGDVLGNLASGMTEGELLKSFPPLTHEDVLACLAYAAERERRCIIDPAA